jgi:hypothetical protein
MFYRLTAIDESDPRWNQRMENWWSQGGALLWNRFGGFGSDSLKLTEEELDLFLTGARAIEGWEPSSCLGCVPADGIASSHPVLVGPYVEEPINADAEVEPPCEESPATSLCCRECGRPLHRSLHRYAKADPVPVPRKQLNHMLHCLGEAVSFGRGEGPNNFRTWEAMLEDLEASINVEE